jgi:probable O-glycosylation ligase (exosortase A-associated)
MIGYDVLLIGAVAVALPVCVVRPWMGVLVYTWLSTMNPHRLAGGAAYDMPVAKLAAVATLVGLLFTKDRYRLPQRRELALIGLLALVIMASTMLTALEPVRAWGRAEEALKVLLMAGAALMLMQERRKLRLWLLVIALSFGALGAHGALFAFETGLRSRLFGPPESVLADNNALGFFFTMALPMLAFLRLDEEVALMRHVLLAGFALTIIALFATYSRGAFIGFVLVLPLIAVLVRFRDKPLLMMGFAACLIVYFAPKQWVERMQTITPTVYKTDSSGSERMKSWYVAWRLGLDHPVLGAGCHPFSPRVYEKYLPGYSDDHDAHNHFLQMLAEHGFTGLLLFVALLVSVLLRLLGIAWRNRGDPQRQWLAHFAQMIGISLIAYIAGGVFINQPHSELLYQLIIAAMILDAIAATPAANGPQPTGKSLIKELFPG